MTLLRLSRGLQSRFGRFRFTLFFTLLLLGAGLIFRSFLVGTLNSALRDTMSLEWAAMKGTLRIQNGAAAWYYDREDPDQVSVISRLQRVYLLADRLGSVLQISDLYATLDDNTPTEIEAAIHSPQISWKVRKDAKGASYLIRSGVVYSNDKSRTPYFVAIGHPLIENKRIVEKFTQLYFGLTAIMIFGAWLSGRRDWQQSLPVN